MPQGRAARDMVGRVPLFCCAGAVNPPGKRGRLYGRAPLLHRCYLPAAAVFCSKGAKRPLSAKETTMKGPLSALVSAGVLLSVCVPSSPGQLEPTGLASKAHAVLKK